MLRKIRQAGSCWQAQHEMLLDIKACLLFHVGYTRFPFDSTACFPIRQTCFTTFIKQPSDAAASALQIIFFTCVSPLRRQMLYQTQPTYLV